MARKLAVLCWHLISKDADYQFGLRRPETFAFLGFTHYCGWTRDGRFIVKHKTQSKRLTRKLKALRQEAWRLMHAPLAEQHRWYASVLRGHYGYYGMPHNWRGARRRSGRKCGASGSSACDGAARRTGAWAGTGSRR